MSPCKYKRLDNKEADCDIQSCFETVPVDVHEHVQVQYLYMDINHINI